MKKILATLFFICFIQAQINPLWYNDKNYLGGGIGVTWINNQPYYSLRLFPEFEIGKVGIGLDLKFEYGADGKLRTENFNETSDYLSIIRYFRYGQKKDPFYFRVGALDYASVGHGTIMYLYNNSPSYDARKIGLELELNFNYYGMELVYGTFGQAGVLGMRGYLKPLTMAGSKIPILKDLEVGVSYFTDMNEYAGVVSGTYDKTTDLFTATQDEGSINIIGFDLGLPIFRNKLIDLDFYFDVNKIINFGSGAAAGFTLGVNGLGIVDIKTKFERRWNGKQYIPSYFNSFYELDRFQLDKNTGFINSKVQQLKLATGNTNGYYGELLIRVLGTFNIMGSYQRLDNVKNSGVLHLYTNLLPKESSLVARAGYDKVNINSETSIFKLDDNSYLYAEFGYKPMKYLIVSMVYQWTFTPLRDANDNIIDFVPQKKVEPRISFVYPL